MLNLKKLKNNKKSQVGSTLTWLPATMLIFFIMLLYILGTGMLVGDEKSKDIPLVPGESKFNELSISELSFEVYLQRQLISFLNSPVVFEGEQMQVKDLIYENFPKRGDDDNREKIIEKKYEKFKELALKFQQDSLEFDSIGGFGIHINPPTNDQSNTLYGDYSVLRDSSHEGLGILVSVTVNKKRIFMEV
ncbi:MAG: hypothetical protein ACOCUU_01500 [Nanoarchaeota archaeon]